MKYLETKSSLTYLVASMLSSGVTLCYNNHLTICITSCCIGLWIFDYAVFVEEQNLKK